MSFDPSSTPPVPMPPPPVAQPDDTWTDRYSSPREHVHRRWKSPQRHSSFDDPRTFEEDYVDIDTSGHHRPRGRYSSMPVTANRRETRSSYLDERSYNRERGNVPRSPRMLATVNGDDIHVDYGRLVEWCPLRFARVDPNTHPSDCCKAWDKTSKSSYASRPLPSANHHHAQDPAKKQAGQSQEVRVDTPIPQADTNKAEQFLKEIKPPQVENKDDKPSQPTPPSDQSDPKKTPVPESKPNKISEAPPPHPAKDDPKPQARKDQSTQTDKHSGDKDQASKDDRVTPGPKEAEDQKALSTTAPLSATTKPDKGAIRSRKKREVIPETSWRPGVARGFDRKGRRQNYFIRTPRKTPQKVLELSCSHRDRDRDAEPDPRYQKVLELGCSVRDREPYPKAQKK